MGKYSKSLATRLQRTLKPFRKLNDKEREYICSREYALKACQYQGGSQPGVAVGFVDYYKNKDWWESDDYIVILDKECATKDEDGGLIGREIFGHRVWNLRINRKDGGRMHDWCVILGPEFEAIEIYPAQSRLMDEANCYHLWIIAPNEEDTEPPRITLGYNEVPKLLMTNQNFERLSRQERFDIKEKKTIDSLTFDLHVALAVSDFPEEVLHWAGEC